MTDEQTTPLSHARELLALPEEQRFNQIGVRRCITALCDELEGAEKVVDAAQEVSDWGDTLVTGYHGFKDTRLHDVKGLREALATYKEKRE